MTMEFIITTGDVLHVFKGIKKENSNTVIYTAGSLLFFIVFSSKKL